MKELIRYHTHMGLETGVFSYDSCVVSKSGRAGYENTDIVFKNSSCIEFGAHLLSALKKQRAQTTTKFRRDLMSTEHKKATLSLFFKTKR